MERDCLWVVSALNSSISCNTMYGNVIVEAGFQACQFQICRVSHVCRGGNKIAHGLARRAISSAGLDDLVEELPFDLESAFQTNFFN